MRALWLSCLAVFGCLTACEKRAPRVRIDPGLMFSVEARFNEVLAKPAVDQAFDGYLDAVFADPEVGRAAEQVAVALAADPKAMAVIDTLMERLQSSPTMQALVEDLMAKHPRASPEEIGELVGQRIDDALDGPKLTASFQVIGTELVRKVDLRGALKSLGDKIDAAITRDYEARWSKRLTELNGGSTPSPSEATKLLLDHALKANRLEKFVIAIVTNPTARAQTAKLVAKILSTPAVSTELSAVVADFAQDPAVQNQTVALFDLLLSPNPDAKAVEDSLRAILLSKRTVDGVSRLLRTIVANPDVAKAAGQAFDTIAADRDLRAAFDDLMTGW